MAEPHTDQRSDGDAGRIEMSRRAFFKGAGLSATSMALLDGGLGVSASAEALVSTPQVLGPGAVALSLSINGRTLSVRVDPGTTLAEVLRQSLGLTGTKIGCDRGACSACTVWVDSEAAVSGHLCRCGTYPNIFKATLAAADRKTKTAHTGR
jgi:hypothetical protein